MSIAVFLPVRKDSERVPNKNTKKFGNLEGGLLELKLKQLVKLKKVDEIIISTNDERSIEIAEQFFGKHTNIRIDKRPDYLASSQTELIDLIQYVPKISASEHILWTHVTSPFCDEKIYKKAIELYKTNIAEGFDSLGRICQRGA